jgi:hypothetical protein
VSEGLNLVFEDLVAPGAGCVVGVSQVVELPEELAQVFCLSGLVL